MSTLATNAITDASGGNTASINGYTPTMSNMAGRNLIINGAMQVAQRGTSSTSNGYATVDRFSTNPAGLDDAVVTTSQETDAPIGFTNSLKFTVNTAESTLADGEQYYFRTILEGNTVGHLAYGTSGAKETTLSFWVKSSLTGDYGFNAVWGSSSASERSYTAIYTVNTANTWEYKTINIPADTDNTYSLHTGNERGVQLRWSLGGINSAQTGTANGSWSSTNAVIVTGTNDLITTQNATFQITGVQWEVGSVATPFEHRQYGQELELCKRYCEVLSSANGSSGYVNFLNGGANSATQARYVLNYSVQKRATPAVTFTTASGFSAQPGNDSGVIACTALVSEHLGVNACQVTATVSSGLTAGDCSRLISNANNTSTITITAEL